MSSAATLLKKFGRFWRNIIHPIVAPILVNLKIDLQSIAKKSGESISDYIERIKEVKDKLANVSIFVNEEDLLIYTLNGLPAVATSSGREAADVIP